MKNWFVALGIALLLIPAAEVRAQGHTAGVQVLGIPVLGVYKTGAGGGAYGYAPSMGYGYAPSPGYGFAAAPIIGYAPAASYGFASSGSGCTGFHAGFSHSGLGGPSYGYGYGVPQAGYGSPQAGLLGGAAGILETIQIIKQIREVFDKQPTGIDAPTKKELEEIRAAVKNLETRLDNLKLPEDAVKQLNSARERLDKIEGIELKKIDDRLKTLEQKKK